MNISSRDVDGLVGIINSAALDPERWTVLLDRLTQLIPGLCPHLYGHDTAIGHAVTTICRGYDPSYVDTFNEYYGRISSWAPAFTRAAPGTFLTSQQMCPDRDLVKGEFFADWINPQEDLRGGGGVVLDRTDTSALLFGANLRLRDRDSLEPVWMALLERLQPALLQAWKTSCALAHVSLERSILRQGHGRDPGVLILDPGGRVRFANEKGQSMLTGGDLLRVDALNRLRAADGLADRRITSRLGQKASPAAAEGVALGSHGGVAHQAALIGFDPDLLDGWTTAQLLGLDSCALMIVVTEQICIRDRAATARVRYGLSASEAEVAMLLAAGNTPAEIAEQRAVSPHTVRNQIKSAMVKCGVHRQVELVSRIDRLH